MNEWFDMLEALGISETKVLLQLLLFALWIGSSWLAVRRVRGQEMGSGSKLGLIVLSICVPFLGPIIVLLYLLTAARPKDVQA